MFWQNTRAENLLLLEELYENAQLLERQAYMRAGTVAATMVNLWSTSKRVYTHRDIFNLDGPREEDQEIHFDPVGWAAFRNRHNSRFADA